MAYGEYLHCIRCDCKVLYDADVDYDVPRYGNVWVSCKECLPFVMPPVVKSPVVVGGEATPTETVQPVHRMANHLCNPKCPDYVPAAVPVPAETPETKLLRDIFTDPARRKEDGVPLNGAFPCQVGCTESAQHWHEMRAGIEWVHPGAGPAQQDKARDAS